MISNTYLGLLLAGCALLAGCLSKSPAEDIRSISAMWEEHKRTEAAHERDRPCPPLLLSGMEVTPSPAPEVKWKFKPTYIGVAPEIVSASKLHWNRGCWAVSGIPPELLKTAIHNALRSAHLLSEEAAGEQSGYILEARVLEQWENGYTNGVDDYSKESHLTIQYTVRNPNTKEMVWEKPVTTTAKVNYGSRAKGGKLSPEQITSNEYRKVIFEAAVKENLTILVKELGKF